MILTITEKMACFSAHRVVCVSASLRERAIALGLVARPKTVLLAAGSGNGVDPSRFELTPEKMALAAALRQDLGIRPNQPVIGFAGRFTRDKGLPELIAAFQLIRREVPETVLLLVGNYEEGDRVPEDIREVIESDPAIHHVGFTSQIELYYLVMTIFVLPTHREGFPNTVLEAQAAGLPVVTTFGTGAVDAIDDGITGLLTPVGDAGKLAEAVLSLLSDPIRMQLMGRLGRERVRRDFRNETVWEALASLYRAMLQERGYPLPAANRVEAMRCAQTVGAACKRILDIAGASIALAVAWPSMAAVALTIRLTMGRPILFRQVGPAGMSAHLRYSSSGRWLKPIFGDRPVHRCGATHQGGDRIAALQPRRASTAMERAEGEK